MACNECNKSTAGVCVEHSSAMFKATQSFFIDAPESEARGEGVVCICNGQHEKCAIIAAKDQEIARLKGDVNGLQSHLREKCDEIARLRTYLPVNKTPEEFLGGDVDWTNPEHVLTFLRLATTGASLVVVRDYLALKSRAEAAERRAGELERLLKAMTELASENDDDAGKAQDERDSARAEAVRLREAVGPLVEALEKLVATCDCDVYEACSCAYNAEQQGIAALAAYRAAHESAMRKEGV